MTTQLYDTDVGVCEVAVMYLEDACSDYDSLERVVRFRPTLDHLGDIGHPLFMRSVWRLRAATSPLTCSFVSTSCGFEYLSEGEDIDRELEAWVTVRHVQSSDCRIDSLRSAICCM